MDERLRRPVGRGGGDELIRAVRKAGVERRLNRNRAGSHEPRAVGKLRVEEELHAALAAVAMGAEHRSVRRGSVRGGAPDVAFLFTGQGSQRAMYSSVDRPQITAMIRPIMGAISGCGV